MMDAISWLMKSAAEPQIDLEAPEQERWSPPTKSRRHRVGDAVSNFMDIFAPTDVGNRWGGTSRIERDTDYDPYHRAHTATGSGAYARNFEKYDRKDDSGNHILAGHAATEKGEFYPKNWSALKDYAPDTFSRAVHAYQPTLEEKAEKSTPVAKEQEDPQKGKYTVTDMGGTLWNG